MKRIFFIATIIYMAMLTSCSREETAGSQKEDSRVYIQVEIPGNIAGTRAQVNIPATHKLRCMIEVWTKETPVLKYREEIAVEAGAVPSFNFALEEGDYDCLMWADFIPRDAVAVEKTSDEVTYNHFEDVCYHTDDLHAVTIKDAQLLFDTDICDAFFAKLSLAKDETPVTERLKMTRPFAKLIVKEKDAQCFATLKKMTASYEVPKGFNVAIGESLVGTLPVSYTKTFEGDKSQVLFTNYIFAPATVEGRVLSAVALSFTTTGTTDCEIPAGSIVLKRNQRVNANGYLIQGGGIDPEPGEDEELNVGDYFFIDGTWSSVLTDENKADCVGIVFAVDPQSGDDITHYGESFAGKSIRGYVMALDNLKNPSTITIENKVTGTSGRPYFYKFDGKNPDASVTPFTLEGHVNLVDYDGYAQTQAFLNSGLFKEHSTDMSYPLLQCFEAWSPTATKPQNASPWYIPSFKQMLDVVGKRYGYAGDDTYPAVSKVEAFAAAFEEAAKPFNTNNNGYHMGTSSLNGKTPAEPVAITVNADGSRVQPWTPSSPVEYLTRPVLTIIK